MEVVKSENERTTQIQGVGSLVFCETTSGRRPYLRIDVNFENGQKYIYSSIDDLLTRFEGRRVELSIKDTDFIASLVSEETFFSLPADDDNEELYYDRTID